MTDAALLAATAAFPERVRADFPVFERRIGGRPIAFFDGPGGSQVPVQVAAAMAEYLTLHNANTHGFFPTSEETDATISGARDAMADLLGAPSPREIVFGANMTTLTFHFARSLAREWREGDEIVVTQLDHQANVAPWRRAAEDHGLTLRVAPMDPETASLDFAALEGMITERTRLVAVGAASNALGTVTDVRRVAELARAAGALSYVDAVAFAPHRRVDVGEIGCDFLACSAYKFFGPHVGIVWGKSGLLQNLTPYKVPPASDTAPERWETGTQNHEGIAGVRATVDWIASLAGGGDGDDRRRRLDRAFEAIEAHEMELFAELEEGLRGIPGVRFYGVERGVPRTPTAAFTVEGMSPDQVARRLGAEGVFVWNGDFYATTVCEALGLADCGGLVRAGVAPYSTREDVQRLVEGVERLARGG